MVRQTLALLLALSLALGGAAGPAAAACAASGPAAALAVPAEDCGTCGGEAGKGPARPGCTALTCATGCISAPCAILVPALSVAFSAAAGKAAVMPLQALRIRAIPPDHPPPR